MSFMVEQKWKMKKWVKEIQVFFFLLMKVGRILQNLSCYRAYLEFGNFDFSF